MEKSVLDSLLDKHKAQPVGDGYIDVIVMRDHLDEFVQNLIGNQIGIRSVAWWEWCEQGRASRFGLGGPRSVHYNGWFSEMGVEVDDFSRELRILSVGDMEKQSQIILNHIWSKIIPFGDKFLIFENESSLVPGLWLSVPDVWKNNYGVQD